MILILKSLIGVDYKIKDNLGNEKVIKLEGAGVINEIDNSDYTLLIEQYPSILQMKQDGFLFISKAKPDIKETSEVENEALNVEKSKGKKRASNE